jgi:metal-responsive CopG/Arc/MetJ family transcriptional regulator
MAENIRFQVRDTEQELEKLDKAIKTLGYKDRADWYRDMKRQAIRQANIKVDVEKPQIHCLRCKEEFNTMTELAQHTYDKHRESMPTEWMSYVKEGSNK